MNYYINPIWFYLMQVSDNLGFLCAACAILSIGFAGVIYVGEEEIKPICKKFVLAGIILIIVAALCPTEKTCLKMMVASQVTKENVANVKEEIYDIVDYIDEKLDDDKED